MNYEELKRYCIHVLPIRAVNSETFDLPKEYNAIIICAETDNQFIYSCEPENTLKMNFRDVENKSAPNAFNKADAERIINFVLNLPNEVADIYVCCSQGISRSPAIAAFLLKASGRNDMVVWGNPYYLPNTLVYALLCQEYGIRSSLKVRRIVNKRAFRSIQKGTRKYERWEILY